MVVAFTKTTPAGEAGSSSLADVALLALMAAVSAVTSDLQVNATHSSHACGLLSSAGAVQRLLATQVTARAMPVALKLSPLTVLPSGFRQLHAQPNRAQRRCRAFWLGIDAHAAAAEGRVDISTQFDN